MKGTDDMAHAVNTENDQMAAARPIAAKATDFLLLFASCGGIGYCIGKFIAGGNFGIVDAAIMLCAAAMVFGLSVRQYKTFPQANRSQEISKYLLQTGVGGVAGLAGMSAILWLFGGELKDMAEQSLYWHLAAILLAALYTLVALVLMLLSASKKMVTTKPGDEPLSDDEYKDHRALFFWAALGMLAYAMVLAVTAIYGNEPGGRNWFALAALCGAVGGQWACSYILWLRYDELYREVTRTACAISYVFVEVMIVLWAGLTLFGFAIRFDPMAVLVIMMSISLMTTVTVSLRRGVS